MRSRRRRAAAAPVPRRLRQRRDAGHVAERRSPPRRSRRCTRRGRDYDFPVLLEPRRSRRPRRCSRASCAARDRAGARARRPRSSYLDLTPPTDARPFFFNQLRLRPPARPGRLHARLTRPACTAATCIATLTLAMLILDLGGAGGWRRSSCRCARRSRRAGAPLAIGGTAYFALIGIGFMMTEIALLQRMSVFLGHPGLCAQHRAVQPDPVDRHRQPGLGAPAARQRPRRLVAWAVLTAALSLPAADLAAGAAARARGRRACRCAAALAVAGPGAGRAC